MEKPRITRSVLVDENGRLLQRSVQTGPKEAPWRNLTREEDAMTMAFPSAWLYVPNGEILPLRKIELLVSTTRFIADGIEECAIQVRGDLQADEKVKILINDQQYEIDNDDMILFSTSVSGIFSVSLNDDNFYADKMSYTIMAISSSTDN
jgi:hypothetical protein